MFVLFSYLSFGLLALAGMAIITFFAPRLPMSSRASPWSIQGGRMTPVWQARLDTMTKQTPTQNTGLVFSSVRRTENGSV